MATFDIQYAQQSAPDQGTAVRGNLDLDTHQQELWAGLANAGSNLANFGAKVLSDQQDARDAIELSTKKRQLDEQMFAGLQAAKSAPDFDSAKKLYDQSKETALSSMTSKSRRVNEALQLHVNDVVPRWDQNYLVHSVERGNKEAMADTELNIGKALDSNNMAAAVEQWDIRRDHNLVTKTQYDEAIRTLPAEMVLRRAQNEIASDDPTRIAAILPTLKDTDKFDANQQKQLIQWRNAGERVLAEKQRDTYDNLALSIENVGIDDKTNVAQKLITLKSLQDQAKTLGDTSAISATNRKVADTRINSLMTQIVSGTRTKPDVTAQLEAQDIVDDTSKELTPDEYKAKRSRLMEIGPLLGDKLPQYWAALNGAYKREQNTSLKVYTQSAAETQGLSPDERASFRSEMSQYRTVLLPMSDADQAKFIAEKAVSFRAAKQTGKTLTDPQIAEIRDKRDIVQEKWTIFNDTANSFGPYEQGEDSAKTTKREKAMENRQLMQAELNVLDRKLLAGTMFDGKVDSAKRPETIAELQAQSKQYTPQEAMKLAKGTRFIGTNGKEYIR